MSEEIKIDRLERIMEVAKMMHDDLWSRTLLRLARQASDIYATAKEEIEARSMLKEETVKSPIEDEKDKEIARLKGNWDYLKEYLVALRNSRLHEECLLSSELNRCAILLLEQLIEKMNAADNNVGSMEV
jgi:hypothetical protein